MCIHQQTSTEGVHYTGSSHLLVFSPGDYWETLFCSQRAGSYFKWIIIKVSAHQEQICIPCMLAKMHLLGEDTIFINFLSADIYFRMIPPCICFLPKFTAFRKNGSSCAGNGKWRINTSERKPSISATTGFPNSPGNIFSGKRFCVFCLENGHFSKGHTKTGSFC